MVIEDQSQFSANGQNVIDAHNELSADGNAMYITEDEFQAGSGRASGSTKKLSATDDSAQYKYVFLNRIGNEILPLESV